MKILDRYVAREFLRFLGLVLATFVVLYLLIDFFEKIRMFMSNAATVRQVVTHFLYTIPMIVTQTLPAAVLLASLITFGTLSRHGEITAMKSCGVSLWQMAAPILLGSILLSGICLYLNANLSPRSHFARRQMLRELGEEDPLALLDEGRFISDFPGVKVYIGKRSGSRIEDIILIQFDKDATRAEVRARAGQVAYHPDTRVMDISLEQVRLTEYDKNDPTDLAKARMLSAESYPITLDLREMLTKSKISKKPTDMVFTELVHAIQHIRRVFPDIREQNVPRMRSKMAVEASQRLALALSCFSFALMAIPLGIRSHRKESSIGIGMALVLFFLFYLFIILSDALVDYPQWRPDLIPWIPVLGCQAIGFALMHKNR